MKLQNFRPIFPFFWMVILCYILHKTAFFVLKSQILESNFKFSIENLYFGFALFSAIIFLILIKVKKKSLDNVGMVFLILATLKMVFSYIFISNCLTKSAEKFSIEKTNFFVMFMLFLIIETLFAIRILNNKQ